MRNDEVRVGLHCHSSLSDGALAPESLAEHLAALGVRYAALADHDTVEGLAAFRHSLSRRGVGCIDGVELSIASEWGEIHLLGYGIDADHPELRRALAASRRRPAAGGRGLVDSLKRFAARRDPPPPGTLDPAAAIGAIHQAGGAAFLAHPLSYGWDRGMLEGIAGALKAAGLDGLEAIYPPYSEEQQRLLADLAGRHGLAVSAGTDFHGPDLPDHPAAVAMSEERWQAFRGAVFQAARRGRPRRVVAPSAPPAPSPDLRRGRPGRFAARIVFPASLAVGLFILAIFAVIIPGFERSLLERKKEMIRELTNSAASILAEYAADARAGRSSLEQAQAAAAARIRDLRYGREGKDYFWITDMRPTMIGHPYRPDLDGRDVSDYTDRQGVRVFVEFVAAVRQKEEGYVEYLWQWKDDAQRIVPKLSFVKRFAPWDWVIGTGIYLEDVKAEIAGIVGRLARLSAGITVALALLLFFVGQQSLAIERGRRRAESSLRESHERYRALVEASTEGMVLVVEGICTYANRPFQEMTGYTEAELSLLPAAELVQAHPGEEEPVRALLDFLAGEPARMDALAPWASPDPSARLGDAGRRSPAAPPPACEGLLLGRDGRRVDVALTASRFSVAGREGAILTARDLGARRRAEAGLLAGSAVLTALWENAGAGFFRAAWGRRVFLLDGNPAARAILGLAGGADLTQVNLFSLLADPRDADRLYGELAAAGAVREREARIRRPDGACRDVVLCAALERDETGAARRLEGMLRDVTEQRRSEQRREELIGELEASSLFLSAAVGGLARRAACCGLEEPVRAAASRMTRGGCDALLVTDPSGEAVGIITDRDLRERVVAARLGPERPVRQIMSAPLVSIPAGARVYEAVLRMREKGINHLAVRDSSGKIAGVLHGADFLRLYRRSLSILTKEIGAAESAEELAEIRARLPERIRELLEGGARVRTINRLFTAASDRVVEKLVGFAVHRLGEPPAAFAFVALGSEGREEQTPASDQDNAIIYSPAPGAGGEEARRYFLALGEIVCAGLDAMEVPFCAGGIMASNPSWCAPLEVWEGYFSRWIRQPEPQEILDCNIFFDLRGLYGERALVERLRARIAALLADNPPFFFHLARDTLQRRLPGLRRGGGAGELDLKEAQAPIVSFARLYALRHGVAATNTFDRLEGLRQRGVLSPATFAAIFQDYTFLMRLRLGLKPAGSGPGRYRNTVDASSLAPGEEARLQEALARLPLLQKRIGFDFPGCEL